MMVFSVLPVLMLALAGGQESLDLVDSPTYWQIKGVAITAENMMAELKEPEAAAEAKPAEAPPAVDYEALVRQMGSEKFAEREAAQKQLEAAGEAAVAALEKGVAAEDPEVSVRSRKALEAIRKPAVEAGQDHEFGAVKPDGPLAKPMRRLMAIRTIGEMKYKEALPLLAKLTDSKVPFEAEYARRSIAQIEGKEYKAPAVDEKLLAADLAAMPQGAMLVFQMRSAPGRIDVKKMMAPMQGMMGRDVNEMMMEATREMIFAFEQVGNVRVDAITGALCYSKSMEEDGWLVVGVRGQFDLEAMRAAAKKAMGGGDDVQVEKLGGVDLLNLGDDFRVALVSENLLVVATHDDRFAPPLETTVTALKEGKPGGLEKNEVLAALVKTVDTKKPIWAAMLITPEMKTVPVLAALSSTTVELSSDETGIGVLLKARGAEAEAVAQCGRLAEAAYQGFVMQAQTSLTEMEQEAPQMAAAFPKADVMKSLQSARFKIDEAGVVTVTGKVDAKLLPMMGNGLPMLFMMGMSIH